MWLIFSVDQTNRFFMILLFCYRICSVVTKDKVFLTSSDRMIYPDLDNGPVDWLINGEQKGLMFEQAGKGIYLYK